MERRAPKRLNKTEIPVNIYEGEKLIKESRSIQEAARFFKEYTKAERFNWSAIHKGIWHDESFSVSGNTYYFITDQEAVKERNKEGVTILKQIELETKILSDKYLDIVLRRYQKFRSHPDYEETYKWEILSELNTYLQNTEITEENVLEVIKYIKSKNPQSGSFTHWSSLDHLMKLAEEAPGLTSELFHSLYDETLPLKDRVEKFYYTGKEYGRSLGAPLFGYLLAAYDFHQYPLYKEEVLKETKKQLAITEKLGTISENYQMFYDICTIVQMYVRDQGHDFSMLDVQDMLFCCTSYYVMVTEVAVEYVHSHAVKLHAFMENDEQFLAEIKAMNEELLKERRDFYRNRDKINRIRYLLLDQWLTKKSLTMADVERLKEEVNEENETNILHSWNNFKILFQIYFAPLKERILHFLRNLHDGIRGIEEFKDVAFEEEDSLNPFGWNQSFGNSECWIAVYPKEIENHKQAAQLFVSIDGDKVRYGLGYGSEHPKRDAPWLIDIITNIEEFTYDKLRKKMLGVYPRFLEDNKKSQLEEYLTPEIGSLQNPEREPQYFWLTTNPIIWTVDLIKDGGEVFYTAFNEKGNKRRIFHSFEMAKPGDKVLFYESTPTKQIVAEGEVTKGLHTEAEPGFAEPVEGVSFRFEREISPVSWDQLIQVEELEESAPIKNGAQGSLFPLTKEQYETILSLEDAEVTDHTIPIPSVDFNREVKLESLFFEDRDLIVKQVKTALAKGKNVILTGPPGTGKSKLAKEICRSFGVDFVMTTATSDWSTYETIGGSRPNADGTLSFKQGLFLNCFKDEKTLKPENKWLIIDEMNRADIDKAFGALFSALTGDPIVLSFQGESGNQIRVRPQNDLESVLPNDYDFIIPNDWRLIGTMNTIDKAFLYEMSYAFMRRFAFIPVGVPKRITEELVNSYLPLWGMEEYAYSSILATVWELINQYRQIGPAIVEDIAQFTEVEGDFTSAVILYVLPQFEGLPDNEILEFINKLGQLDQMETERLKDFAADFFHIRV
ncbi:EVE domain-containing protein [Mesobacillus maritimus]|uniref:AAA family ATPase n=1 Tax=Mesobacillus maritimus TaxID=1643336 RepID=UPI0020416473|nr:AAA family ATPase [Mesobacillus maritimus]MCM3585030.1 EVE domain-containing protein [Mesobacillus maritimus]